MPNFGKSVSREERVRMTINQDQIVHKFENYVPNDNSVDKIKMWKSRGAEIYYLTSRDTEQEIEIIRGVLTKYGFPDVQNLLYRKTGEQYKDVAERLMPDIVIEDDCESIGGESEMTYPHIREDLKSRIKSVVVKEFGGISMLPDNFPLNRNY